MEYDNSNECNNKFHRTKLLSGREDTQRSQLWVFSFYYRWFKRLTILGICFFQKYQNGSIEFAGICVACPFSYCSEVAIRHPIKTKTVRSTVLPYIILSKGIPQTQGQNDPEVLTERFVRSDLWIYIKVLLKWQHLLHC